MGNNVRLIFGVVIIIPRTKTGSSTNTSSSRVNTFLFWCTFALQTYQRQYRGSSTCSESVLGHSTQSRDYPLRKRPTQHPFQSSKQSKQIMSTCDSITNHRYWWTRIIHFYQTYGTNNPNSSLHQVPFNCFRNLYPLLMLIPSVSFTHVAPTHLLFRSFKMLYLYIRSRLVGPLY